MTLRNKILEEIAYEAARAHRHLKTANEAHDEGDVYREQDNLNYHLEDLAKIEAYKTVIRMIDKKEK